MYSEKYEHIVVIIMIIIIDGLLEKSSHKLKIYILNLLDFKCEEWKTSLLYMRLFRQIVSIVIVGGMSLVR